MSDSLNNANPYEAYVRAMMAMQQEMMNAYMTSIQNGEQPPMMPPQMNMMPAFPHPAFCHPYQMPPMGTPFPPHMMPPPPSWPHPGMTQSPSQPQHPPQPPETSESDPLFEQAQAMLDGALGEEAGMFKEILGTFGMNDKEFWKGAMVGAAAALLLSNENVRGKLMGLVSGAGDLLKSGGSSVKEGAVHTASAVKDNVSTGSEIFKDTYAAGKQGFQESVKRHQTETHAKDAPGEDTQGDDSQRTLKEHE
ncbi:YtxH domain-containing protein [Vibrio furnissii]|uniref:YtxH domain-containing protein n=1 Tax=Vibrio furnissii TaxID=29494 RepID=UPI0023DADA3D|nr:YtxH domain-containing protein [Vibrio furnissii]